MPALLWYNGFTCIVAGNIRNPQYVSRSDSSYGLHCICSVRS